ncbi:hypothetical protein L208DRAFT_1377264 [Tricholoma matsutake]|nr:hypothetical protein L208DRAFT_1377264 [Tricholoma matsutake 945]
MMQPRCPIYFNNFGTEEAQNQMWMLCVLVSDLKKCPFGCFPRHRVCTTDIQLLHIATKPFAALDLATRITKKTQATKENECGTKRNPCKAPYQVKAAVTKSKSFQKQIGAERKAVRDIDSISCALLHELFMVHCKYVPRSLTEAQATPPTSPLPSGEDVALTFISPSSTLGHCGRMTSTVPDQPPVCQQANTAGSAHIIIASTFKFHKPRNIELPKAVRVLCGQLITDISAKTVEKDDETCCPICSKSKIRKETLTILTISHDLNPDEHHVLDIIKKDAEAKMIIKATQTLQDGHKDATFISSHASKQLSADHAAFEAYSKHMEALSACHVKLIAEKDRALALKGQLREKIIRYQHVMAMIQGNGCKTG